MTAFGIVLFFLVSEMSANDLVQWMSFVGILIVLFIIYAIIFAAILRGAEILLMTATISLRSKKRYIVNRSNSTNFLTSNQEPTNWSQQYLLVNNVVNA